MVEKINSSNFESFIQNDPGRLVMIDFYADWCVPCKMLMPILEQISENYDVKIGKVNINESPECFEKIGTKGVPTLVLYKNNAQLDVKAGFQNKVQLVNWIENHK